MSLDLSADELEVLARWALNGQASLAARTIAAVAMGLHEEWFDFPRSGRDFASCAQLMRKIPALEQILPEVAAHCPGWEPIVLNWIELTRLHDQDRHEPPRYERIKPAPGWLAERVLVNRRACYERLQELLPACLQASGQHAVGDQPKAELPTFSLEEPLQDKDLVRNIHRRPLVSSC